MKTAIFLALVATVLVNECAGENVTVVARQYGVRDQYVVDCMGEAGVTNETLTFISASADYIGAEKKISCMTACILEKKGSMTGNKINVEDFQHEINNIGVPEQRKKAMRNNVNHCVHLVKNIEDKCLVIKTYSDCMVLRTLVQG